MDITAPINPASLYNAKGLVCVITGGGSGLGIAIASALYQNGASKVYLLGRRQSALDEAIATLKKAPSPSDSQPTTLVAVSCDVTSQDSVNAAVDQITKETGYVDVLFNNAGVIGPLNGTDLYRAESIEQLRDTMVRGYDDWGMTMAINTQSIVGVSAAFLPLLQAANTRRGWESGRITGGPEDPRTSGKGTPRKQDKSALSKLGYDADDDRLAHIITTASVASFLRYSTAGLAYNATKAAAAQLGKILSSFLAEWGIRSNVICPGPYPSEMTAGIEGRYGTNQIPQGRMGNLNDFGALTLFLVGKGGAYINGTIQLTDGGRAGVFPGTY